MTIESAESTVVRLQHKRAGIVARVVEISHERASVGFDVHAGGNDAAG